MENDRNPEKRIVVNLGKLVRKFLLVIIYRNSWLPPSIYVANVHLANYSALCILSLPYVLITEGLLRLTRIYRAYHYPPFDHLSSKLRLIYASFSYAVRLTD